jgi:hypothetical protein
MLNDKNDVDSQSNRTMDGLLVFLIQNGVPAQIRLLS